MSPVCDVASFVDVIDDGLRHFFPVWMTRKAAVGVIQEIHEP